VDADSPTVVLSVLDTAPIWAGSPPARSLRDTMDLARRVEEFGYRRYWVAEHHNTPGVASCSPPVLVAELANVTTRLRVGSGGVMLPNHPPLVVAEQFGTLEVLHPGRIDLGLGRAPGTDPRTAEALRRATAADDFPNQVRELIGYFDEDAAAAINAPPAAGNRPAVWLLGSSGSSARLAGQLGLPFVFAHHLKPDATLPALEIYRRSFQPSALLPRPYAIVSALVIAADSDQHARWLATPLGPMALRMAGRLPDGPHLPPELAVGLGRTPADQELIRQRLATRIIGGPDTVRRQIRELVAGTAADELMVTTLIHDQADRVRSYELLAQTVAAVPTPA
jgi:luciferase family oxidoreductase group 1